MARPSLTLGPRALKSLPGAADALRMLDPLRSIVLTVLAVLLPEGLRPDSVAPPVITISPSTPPSPGDTITISTTGMSLPCWLDLTWNPDGSGPSTLYIDESGSATLVVPQADSLKVTDPNGVAEGARTMID